MYVKIGNYAYTYMLSYVPTSKFSMAKLVCYRKYCSCKLKIYCKVSLPNTLNETYNRPPYILAAGSGNKIWWSKVVGCIHKEAPCPNSPSYFISIGAVQTKVPSLPKVTYFATV